MCAFRRNRRTNIVSFSGIDGSGKTTQIDALCTRMNTDGRRVRLVRFWDDIAKLTRIRETTGHRLFKGDKGVGSPSAPINRRDKNVRSSFMTVVRLILYLIDAVSLRIAVEKALRSDADLVILDRYIYDGLANLTLRNRFMRVYVRLIMMLVPRPHISYLLDADPVAARARKPEYPLEFLYINRQSYLTLNDLVGGMTVIGQMPLEDASRAVIERALHDLKFRVTEGENEGSTTLRESGAESANLNRPQTRPASS